MKNIRKAQLKIQEMSFMLLALVVFFAIAGLLFITLTSSNLKNDAIFLAEQKAISSVVRLADSPEFSCGEQQCIDVDKLVVLINRPVFKGFWDFSGLVIRKLPLTNNPKACALGNYINCDMFTVKEPEPNSKCYQSFVALCRKESTADYSYDKCELGQIEVCVKNEA